MAKARGPSPDGRRRSSRADSQASTIASSILSVSQQLRESLRKLRFDTPVTHIYNPFEYAWLPYCDYVRRYAGSRKRVVFLGMNPGPFGMVQTGVPFGEVAAARDWLGIRQPVGQPENPHPSRPVEGFDCPRSEVSGRRLWGFFASRFGEPSNFFREHLVLNYCPLAFMEGSGRNRTPDKLPPRERDALFARCDDHLRGIVQIVEPEWVVGIGGFAFNRATEAIGGNGVRIGQILHPSPACPAANRDWAGTVTRQLEALGLW